MPLGRGIFPGNTEGCGWRAKADAEYLDEWLDIGQNGLKVSDSRRGIHQRFVLIDVPDISHQIRADVTRGHRDEGIAG